MKTATSSTKNRPHYWSDAELKKVGIEIRDERRGVLLCKKCGSEWSAEPPPAAHPRFRGCWKCLQGCHG
jgi:hypothetical protein